MRKIRVGLMGFGEIGRHLYRLILDSDHCEVVAISDIADPVILHYLLTSEAEDECDLRLEGKELISGDHRARFFQIERPQNMPWDLYGIDFVIDTTHKSTTRASLLPHLSAGAKRVILPSLPEDDLDRVAIIGVNEKELQSADRLVSAGSGTTNAAALMIKILDDAFGVETALFTTIHEYTGDQPLRDVANLNPRRSRSAVENIIPNQSPSAAWLERLLPSFGGRIEGSALNVPVPAGSLLDLVTVLKKEGISKEDVMAAVDAATKDYPDVIQITEDPIVSTDIIGNTHSLIYDEKASMQGKGRMFKSIAWYHNTLSVAARILEVMQLYAELDKKEGRKS